MKNKKEKQLTFDTFFDTKTTKSKTIALNEKVITNTKDCTIESRDCTIESIEDRLKEKQKNEDLKIFRSILSRTRHMV